MLGFGRRCNMRKKGTRSPLSRALSSLPAAAEIKDMRDSLGENEFSAYMQVFGVRVK